MVKILIVIAIVAAILLRWRWVARTGFVPPLIAEAARGEMCAWVAERTPEPKVPVNLEPFWRAQSWTQAQQYKVLQPLIASARLHPYPWANIFDASMFFVTFNLFLILPGRVTLSEREWWRTVMSNADNTPSIVVGDITGGHNQIGGSHNTLSHDEGTADAVAELVRALREDAADASPEEAQAALASAEGLEEAVNQGRWDTVTKWIRKVSALVSSSASMMNATQRALNVVMDAKS